MSTESRSGLRVLVVEDDTAMRGILTRHLDRMGYRVEGASSASEALGRMRSEVAQIVLSDIRMPGMDGRSLLQVLLQQYPGVKVVLMTAFGSVDAAVEAMQAGAYSYVCKPFKVEEIAAVLRNAAQEIGLGQQVAQLRAQVRGGDSADRLLGPSEAMQTVRRLVREAAAVSAPVLLTGASGTGKELAARAIHHESPRRAGAFVPVNCAALPETLFESEMFGFRKGAFTGATHDRPGFIERSSGGTLFLDEVAEIPHSQQAKLLRVLDDQQLQPLGATSSVAVDLRVLCATNRNLGAMVRAEQFREDLFFRINVLPIPLPPLANRREDIAPLAEHLLVDSACGLGLACHGLTDEALEDLASRPWPGNVRQLRNTLERALIGAPGRRIARADLPDESSDEAPASGSKPEAAPPLPVGRTLAEMEQAHIARVLDETGWNRSAAARALGIDRRTLFSKIQRYGLIGPGKSEP